jgi:SOUL heme-binding protein
MVHMDVEQKRLELEAALRQSGIEVEPEAHVKLLQYYPPFAPGWIRLNELLLDVDEPPDSAAE